MTHRQRFDVPTWVRATITVIAALSIPILIVVHCFGAQVPASVSATVGAFVIVATLLAFGIRSTQLLEIVAPLRSLNGRKDER